MSFRYQLEGEIILPFRCDRFGEFAAFIVLGRHCDLLDFSSGKPPSSVEMISMRLVPTTGPKSAGMLKIPSCIVAEAWGPSLSPSGINRIVPLERGSPSRVTIPRAAARGYSSEDPQPVRARKARQRQNSDVSRLKFTDHLPTISGCQSIQQIGINVFREEVHRTVDEDELRAAYMVAAK